MTRTVASETTLGTYLGSIPWANQSYLSLAFNFVSGKGKEHTPGPLVKSPIPSSTTSFTLIEAEVFKDKHTILRRPLHQLLRGNMAEVLSAASLLPLQPFEGASNRLCALALCLTGLKLPLKPLYLLASSLVPNPSIKAGDEKLPTIGVNGNQGISFIEVNTNRKNAWCLWNLNGKGNITDKPALLNLHCDAIYLLGSKKHRLEIIGCGIAKTFPATHRPDREGAVLLESGIPTPLTDKEESKGALKPERPLEPMSIAPGRGIGSGDKSDNGASELSGKPALDPVVGSFVQGEGFERLAIVPAY
jgi:hypothetical protein